MTTNTFDFAVLIGGLDVSHIVRAETIDGAPWFVAADVFHVLGLGNRSQHRLINLSDDEQRIDPLLGSGVCRSLACCLISKRGLFKLIMGSRHPRARLFQDWIVRDVFPSIRQTGKFTMETEPAVLGGLPITSLDLV